MFERRQIFNIVFDDDGTRTIYKVHLSINPKLTKKLGKCCAMTLRAIKTAPFPAVIVKSNDLPARTVQLILFSGSCTFNCK